MARRGAPWWLLCLTFLCATAKHVDKGSPAQPFTPFWFTVEPQDLVATRGGPALLNCSAHSGAATPVRIEWKKDGTFLSPAADDRRQVLPDGSLFFTHVVHSKHNKPDEGTYQCVATIDSLGSISSRTARLSVAAWIASLFRSILTFPGPPLPQCFYLLSARTVSDVGIIRRLEPGPCSEIELERGGAGECT
ncbi:hypothetical protein WMY93_012713 [Mugilogobius chulae]|uniref:Ig-like domain-containing protein n=1 Tax=Mugilogobius chulae TaxID=88201 RepID=A0AAW0P812_9GOBI